MSRQIIKTGDAPDAIGTYSQAVKTGNTVYISGQIPLNPQTMEVVQGIEPAIEQVFENLKAIAQAAGGSLQSVVKFTVYLDDLGNFAKVNEVMARYVEEPYPARAAIQVAALPKDVPVEIDAVLVLDN